MNPVRISLVGSLAFGALIVTTPAAADVPPIDLCFEVGTRCDSAGPEGNNPGVCVMSRCSRALPPGMGGAGAGGDGGTIVYDCFRCMRAGAGGAGEGGAGGAPEGGTTGTQGIAGAGGVSEEGAAGAQPAGGASGEPGGGVGGTASKGEGEGCDCGLVPRGSEQSAGLWLLIGLAALASARRR